MFLTTNSNQARFLVQAEQFSIKLCDKNSDSSWGGPVLETAARVMLLPCVCVLNRT